MTLLMGKFCYVDEQGYLYIIHSAGTLSRQDYSISGRIYYFLVFTLCLEELTESQIESFVWRFETHIIYEFLPLCTPFICQNSHSLLYLFQNSLFLFSIDKHLHWKYPHGLCNSKEHTFHCIVAQQTIHTMEKFIEGFSPTFWHLVISNIVHIRWGSNTEESWQQFPIGVHQTFFMWHRPFLIYFDYLFQNDWSKYSGTVCR